MELSASKREYWLKILSKAKAEALLNLDMVHPLVLALLRSSMSKWEGKTFIDSATPIVSVFEQHQTPIGLVLSDIGIRRDPFIQAYRQLIPELDPGWARKSIQEHFGQYGSHNVTDCFAFVLAIARHNANERGLTHVSIWELVLGSLIYAALDHICENHDGIWLVKTPGTLIDLALYASASIDLQQAIYRFNTGLEEQQAATVKRGGVLRQPTYTDTKPVQGHSQSGTAQPQSVAETLLRQQDEILGAFHTYSQYLEIGGRTTLSHPVPVTPLIQHELTHYCQQMMTAIGMIQNFLYYDFFAETCHLLEEPNTDALPLGKGVSLDAYPWHRLCELLFSLTEEAFDLRVHTRFTELWKANRSACLRSVSGESDRCFVDLKINPPTMEINWPHEHQSIPIGLRFISECEAHLQETVLQMVQVGEEMSLNDFITNYCSEVYLAPALFLPQSASRIGRDFTYTDWMSLCMLACRLALDASAVPYMELFAETQYGDAGSKRLCIVNPGRVFVRALRAGTDIFLRSREQTGFLQMANQVLRKLGYPSYERIVDNLISWTTAVLEAWEEDNKDSPRHLVPKSFGENMKIGIRCLEKWRSTLNRPESGELAWLNVWRFGNDMLAEGILPFPTISTPTQYLRMLGGINRDPSDTERLHQYWLITWKLWYDQDLACYCPSWVEHGNLGSIAEICPDKEQCLKKYRTQRLQKNDPLWMCTWGVWKRYILEYPGMGAFLRRLKIKH